VARKCRLKDENHVRGIIRETLAKKLGEVEVIENGGRSSTRGGLRSNRYRITVYLPDEDPAEAIPGHSPVSGNDDPGPQPPLIPRHSHPLIPLHGPPEPSCRTVIEPSSAHAQFEDEFAVIWDVYPKKVDRKRALRAYASRRSAGVSADDLLTAAKNYAKAMVGQEPLFIKHAATFFGPDEPYADFVGGVPAGATGSGGPSRSMANVDRVLAAVTPSGRRELHA
jgi:hypothetical protein